jgi:cell division septum initiation protein DivIVA
MSLSLATLPNPIDEVRRLRQENEALREEVREAREEATSCRREAATAARGVQELRSVLTPLYQGLQRIFGHIEDIGGTDSGATASPRVSAVWESWKAKLGGQTAEAIDVLALHGEMNAEQLRIHLRCARTHVYNVISKLNKAGIINKNGGKIRLKEL